MLEVQANLCQDLFSAATVLRLFSTAIHVNFICRTIPVSRRGVIKLNSNTMYCALFSECQNRIRKIESEIRVFLKIDAISKHGDLS